MAYGGSVKEAAKVVGKTGDGGIPSKKVSPMSVFENVTYLCKYYT
jgi:restriction endonuclease Mrr